MLATIVEDFAMHVDLLVIFEPFYYFACLFQSLFEAVWVGPREIGSIVPLAIEGVEVVRPGQRKALVHVRPCDRATAPLPFFRVGRDSEHGFQARFI